MNILNAILHFDQTLHVAIAEYGSLIYLVLFAMVFCETAFLALFFLPGDPLLFIAGALCATNAINIWILMALLFAAAVVGSIVNYRLGNAVGSRLSRRNYRWLNRAALQRTHEFYEKHGGVTFLIAPFIAVIRTFAPFIAGASAMTFKKFLLYTIAGDAIWVTFLVPGGYFFGNVPLIRDHLNTIILAGIGLGVGSLLLTWLNKYRKSGLHT